MNRKRIVLLAAVLSLICTQAFAVGAGKKVTWDGGGYGVVKFEGDEHAEKGYTCESCHPALFQMKKGAAEMTMAALNQGKFCGACHDGKTAFGTNDPEKCHECHKGKKEHHHDQEKHNGHEKHHD
ncbi:MAG: hypothetical protein OHK006_03290 [Thermodesulfovibrionales bacterium]